MSPAVVGHGLSAGYGRKRVLHDVDLSVAPGAILTVLGHNGAGKTTLLQCLAGLIKPMTGTIECLGGHPEDQMRSGAVTYVPSERFVYPDLTVEENLMISLPRRARHEAPQRLDAAFGRYPVLADRRGMQAGLFSGGQQRMLSLGMALMRRPQLLLLDEPSLGLAPAVQDGLFSSIRSLATDDGLAVVLVEQNVTKALETADEALVLRSGRIVSAGPAAELLRSDKKRWWELF